MKRYEVAREVRKAQKAVYDEAVLNGRSDQIQMNAAAAVITTCGGLVLIVLGLVFSFYFAVNRSLVEAVAYLIIALCIGGLSLSLGLGPYRYYHKVAREVRKRLQAQAE